MRVRVTITPDEIKPDTKWALTQGLDTIGVVERYDWPAGHRLADTPYELWTPSHTSDTPVPRFATLDEAAAAADETAEHRARTSDLKPYEAHRETYRGSEITITFHPATAGDRHRRLSHHTATIDGRSADCPRGPAGTVTRKLRQKVDVQRADEDLLPKLRPLTDAIPNAAGRPGWDGDAAPETGDIAYVWSRGMYRRGLVVNVARTRATVAYTTATNPDRVHRKADTFHELVAG